MSVPTYMHHSGWPWPLDAVQDWFESLWDSLRLRIEQVATWVWDRTPGPLKDFITFWGDLTAEIRQKISAFFKDPLGSIKAGFDMLHMALVVHVGWWDPKQGRFVGGFLGWLWDSVGAIKTGISDAASWIYTSVSVKISDFSAAVTGAIAAVDVKLSEGLEWLEGKAREYIADAETWISVKVDWLAGEVSAGLEWAVDRVGVMFDGASTILGDVIGSVFSGPLGAMSGFFGELLLMRDTGSLTDFGANVFDAGKAFGFSPAPPNPTGNPEAVEAYLKALDSWAFGIDGQVRQLILTATVLEAASLGQIDVAFLQYFLAPRLSAFNDSAKKVWQMEFEAAIGIKANQYFLARHTPMVPPIEDLIRFVVREVITPERFYDLTPFMGFSREFAENYWEAHWILPAPTVLYDSYHRGFITAEELDKYLVLHDFKPEPRPGITKNDVEIQRSVLKTLIPRVDLGYGWDMGRLTDEELLERYEWLGYEDDSELMTDIQKERAMVEEVSKLRGEWISDAIDGYITLEVLAANLAEIGIGPARIEYYVAYAKKRRERDHKKALLAVYLDGYLKDLLTDEDLAEQAGEILIDPEALNLFLEKAYTTKYKKPKVS